jgi:Zn-dependent peptidase ImmA (M78 family)
MMIITYPHFRPSLEPKRLRAQEIWAIGEAARAQVCGTTQRPKLDVMRVIRRSRQLSVNGLAFETHWELGRAITDDAGNPVMGAVEHDESWPEAAMIYLNGEEIGDRDDLSRSTAAHELGHAIFDTPSWIQRSRQRSLPFGPHGPSPERRFQLASTSETSGQASPTIGIDWREWRANEFMGAFLAPRHLLHRHMHKRASALGLPMTGTERADDLPVINGRKAGFDAIETLAIDLAETFGVSIDFIQVRLRKYRLISGR